MNKTQYNQYLVKKAQRGMTRFQKMAAGRGFGPALNHYTPTDTPATTEERHAAIRESTEPFEVTPPPIEEATPAAEDKPTDKSNPYLPYALGSAGAGALIGALINLVRKKSVLSGALVGGGIGAGLGAGHKYLMDNNESYAKNNFIEPAFQRGIKAYNDAKASMG